MFNLAYVHLPVADSERDPTDVPGTWHSQAMQDRVVLALHRRVFGKNACCGFFVDLAANEPVRLSNTRTLERDFQWRGICIEAQQKLWQKLARERLCKVVGTAIAVHDEVVTFGHHPQSDKSGIVGMETPHGRSVRTETVPAVSLAKVLRSLGAPRTVDYLSLDIEGAELLAMRSFPYSAYNVSMLTVERPSPALRALLNTHGYSYVCDNGWFSDELWMHQSFADRALKLGGPPFIVDEGRLAGWTRAQESWRKSRCRGEAQRTKRRWDAARPLAACSHEKKPQCAAG